MTWKEELIDSFDGIKPALETILGTMLVVVIYLIIKPDGLSIIIFEANESIRAIDLILQGLPIYLFYKVVEWSKPLYVLGSLPFRLYTFIRSMIIFDPPT